MSGQYEVDFDEVKASIPGRSKFLAQNILGLSDEQLSGSHAKCPFSDHGGERDFRFDNLEGRGTFICTCCAGDLVKLIRKLRGCSFYETMKLIYYALNGTPSAPRLKPVVAEFKSPENPTNWTRKHAISNLWRAAAALSADDPADRYLRNRVIKLKVVSKALRFHPKVDFLIDGRIFESYPALLAAFSHNDDLIQVQRIALTIDGKKALSKPSDKQLMPKWKDGVMNGGSVKLQPADDELGVCEGVETGLAAHILFGLPVWSCLTANLLTKVQIPVTVRRVTIFSDNDRSGTGQRAAAALRDRLIADGLECETKLPEIEGQDFNDVLISQKAKSAQ